MDTEQTPPDDTATLVELGKLLDKGITRKHVQILTKFYSLRGRYLLRKEVTGQRKQNKPNATEEIPPDSFVSYPHRLHNLTRGVFPSKGSGYALSIQLNPTSRFGFEIDSSSPTLLIQYDFGSNPNLKSSIDLLQQCLDNDMPFGMIVKKGPDQNKILGLGKISSRIGTAFNIAAYGISAEESKRIQYKTNEEFESVRKDILLDRIEKIDWEKYLAEIDFTATKFTKPRSSESIDRNPFTIRDIKRNTETEGWVIPIFQRFFDWSNEDIKDLWNSIFRGYYVGAFLLWEAKNDPDVGTEHITGVIGDNTNARTNYVILDGQQRITAIYYAITSHDFNLKRDTRKYFYIDFQEFFNNEGSDNIIKLSASKITETVSHEKLLFPIYQLEGYSTWIRGLRDYLFQEVVRIHQKVDSNEFQRINNLVDVMSSRLEYLYDQFKIPSVILPKMSTAEEVAEIFEKINTKGKPLNTFDLLIARLYKYKIKMRDLWKETREKHPAISKYSNYKTQKLNLYIMEAMSLAFSKNMSCKRKDILDYFKCNNETPASFEQKWIKMSEYTEKALVLLKDPKSGFGVASRSELPFEPMISVLSALLYEIETKFDDSRPRCFEKLKNWYWASVFSLSYSQGAVTQKSSDYKELVKWFENEESIPKNIEKFRRDYDTHLNLESASKPASAIYRGLLCILSLKGATDPDKSIVLGTEKHNQDHIFPKSKYGNEAYVDSILNKTWLTSHTNVKKSAKLPSEYMLTTLKKKYGNNESKFLKILESHLIDKDAFMCIKSNNFEGFVARRKTLMLSEIETRIGART